MYISIGSQNTEGHRPTTINSGWALFESHLAVHKCSEPTPHDSAHVSVRSIVWLISVW